MTKEEIGNIVLEELGEIAPEADPQSIEPDVSFRDQLDIDSMDFLNFVIALHKKFHIEIPEKDYPKFFTLNGCVEYVSSHSASHAN